MICISAYKFPGGAFFVFNFIYSVLLCELFVGEKELVMMNCFYFNQ